MQFPTVRSWSKPRAQTQKRRHEAVGRSKAKRRAKHHGMGTYLAAFIISVAKCFCTKPVCILHGLLFGSTYIRSAVWCLMP